MESLTEMILGGVLGLASILMTIIGFFVKRALDQIDHKIESLQLGHGEMKEELSLIKFAIRDGYKVKSTQRRK